MRHLAALTVVGACLAGTPVHAEDIRVVSSVAVKAVLDELAAAFERTSKHTVTPVYGIASALRTNIEAGEAFDVAILTPPLLDELAAKHIVDSSPRPVVARTGLGFMVKAGAAKPDVSSVDAFTRTVRRARAISYVPTGASGVAFLAILQKLGLADAVKGSLRPVATGEEVNASITTGTADLAVLPVSEILPVPGAELGGVFPPEIQSYVVMAAGVNARSPRAAAARDFVAFLIAPQNTAVIRTRGMER